MTPVINPWVFYLMPVCQNVSDLVWLLCVLIGVALFFITIGCIAATVDEYDELRDKLMKIAKKIAPLFLILALIACLIPSEETLTKMIVAQNVTVDRVEMVSDTVVTVYNDIMNLFRDTGAANG